MLTFFRKFAKSPLGLAIFGLVVVAFIVTLYDSNTMFGGGGTGGAIAKVGDATVTDVEATRRVQTQLDAARQQNPELDMATLVANGGADQIVDQMIAGRALEIFAANNGLIASRKLVDGSIASIAAFNGPEGKFDRATFLNLLSQRRIPEAQLREDFGREAITKMLLIPVAGGVRAPLNLVGPYATLLLEAREGQIAVAPTAAFASNTPVAEAELAGYYKRNVARYTVPERRVIKVARFDRSRFDGKIAPSETEIAAAYKAGAAKYAGRETRSFTQIIVPKQADAEALLAKVRGGTAMADAAKSVGLEALSVAATDKAAFARLTGPRVADAGFATAKGGYAAVTQSGLGFHIVRVDNVATIEATSLDVARGVIVTELAKVKTDEALADLVAKIDDDINGGATFDDVVKTHGLAASAMPAITASGVAPDVQGFTLPPELQPLLRDAFQAEAGDDPQVSSVGNGTSFALYHVDRIIPSAPKPLADIRDQVTTDAQTDRAARAARAAANAIAAEVNKGAPLAQALAKSTVKLPAAKPLGARRIDLAQAADKAPPTLKLLFSLPEKRASILAAPQNAGWFIVFVDKVVPGNSAQAAPLFAPTQQQLTSVLGDEYVQQFANAVKAKVGVTRNDTAVAAFKRSLTGGAAR